MTTLRTVCLALVLLPGCASTGATLDHPPYYTGASVASVSRDAAIGHLPIAFQRGASQAPIFDPRTGQGTPMDRLLDEMNAYLDSIGASARVIEPGRASAAAPGAAAVPPDVRFGCIPENEASGEDCAEPPNPALGRGRVEMRLSASRPSREWVAWHRDVMTAAGTALTLVLTLEVGQYLTRQEGLLGNKVVELGTGHRARLPWLTSLEGPVMVLQLTAALVDRDGKVVRIGAEGIYPKRSRFLVSVIGAQELLTDEDVEAVRSYRREDLPGVPLAWQVALRELVSRMTGRSVGG